MGELRRGLEKQELIILFKKLFSVPTKDITGGKDQDLKGPGFILKI